MQYKKFDPTDINKNVIKAYPENYVTFNSGSVYLKNLSQITSSELGSNFSSSELGPGSISYVFAGNPINFLNAKDKYKKIYTINGINPTAIGMKPINITKAELYSNNQYSDYITTSNVTSSIFCYLTSSYSPVVRSIKNALEWHSYISPSYNFSNFEQNGSGIPVALINIPSIFYGSTIKKGSVRLSYYYTGSLVSTIEDIGYDGRLVETVKNSSLVNNAENSAGVVLYDEGIILLSGSWDLLGEKSTKWNLFSSASSDDHFHSGSYDLVFKGTNYIPTITMLAHAEKNEFNTTVNKTAIDHLNINSNFVLSSSNSYKEDEKRQFKNTVLSNYDTVSGSFKKQTFINKIGIYDENYKLIAVAKLANPVKKNNEREYTFKLKMDI